MQDTAQLDSLLDTPISEPWTRMQLWGNTLSFIVVVQVKWRQALPRREGIIQPAEFVFVIDKTPWRGSVFIAG